MNPDLQILGERLGSLIAKGLGPRSRWALSTSLDAAEVEGIAGVVCIKIPAKPKDFIDVCFTAGTVDVVTRWGATT